MMTVMGVLHIYKKSNIFAMRKSKCYGNNRYSKHLSDNPA